jgi:catechol 2,3-dioxygenase-like lactoylglutathione lyase family enzyme
MSVIKVEDIAFIRYAAPDLGKMRTFLEDFGMMPAPEVGDGALRMRGAGSAPFLHETIPGEPGFRAIGLRAESVEDLRALAQAQGVEVKPLSTPGGGCGATLYDPDGIRVEVVAGQAAAPEVPLADLDPWNSAVERRRTRRMRPLASGKAMVVRLGHGVLRVTDVRRSEAWWKDCFGFITSDEVRSPEDEPLAIFLRCDRGSTPTDHHTLLLSQMKPGDKVGFHHAAFEVRDFDDLMRGHEHLAAQGYEAGWGIGRHVLGGQVFDYWLDPYGNRMEHWTDGDLFTAEDGSNVVGADVMFRNHWGPPPSERFMGA